MFGVLRPGSPAANHGLSTSVTPPPPNSLAPMPSGDFKSREAIMEGVKEWSANQGYAVVIARSRFNRIWLKCDRGGTYENRRNITPDQRKRKRGESRLVGCPFKIVASIRKDGTWHLETENPEHNHEPSEDLSLHPTFRRMTDEQLQKVHDGVENGVTPAETLEELRKLWPDIKVLTRDVYNARKKYKTTKDQAAIDAGLPPPSPVQDPNGIIPGPNNRGRWAWVPDGEEVTNKKGRRRRRTAPAPEAPVDPQLNTPNQPMQNDQSLSTGDQHLINQLSNGIASFSAPHMSSQNDNADTNANWMGNAQATANGFNHSPTRLRSQHQQSPNHGNMSDATPMSGRGRPFPATGEEESSANIFNQSPSRLRSQAQQRSYGQANLLSPPSGTNASQNNAVTGEDELRDGEDIEARMVRMEKEQKDRMARFEKDQKDQKELLAAILSAVNGRPGGSPT